MGMGLRWGVIRFYFIFNGPTRPCPARPAIVGVFYPLWARTHARTHADARDMDG